MYNNQDRNKINLNPGIKKYIKDSHPVFSTKTQRRSSEWMRQSWQREGGPALRWWRLPVMKRSVAAGRSRRAVGDGVGSFFSSTSSVSLLNWVIRVMLWPMLPHRWNRGGGKPQQPGSYELGGASVHFVSLSHAYKYSCEKKWRREFSNLSEREFRRSFASVLTLRGTGDSSAAQGYC